VPELGSLGSGRGALSNGRPYREPSEVAEDLPGGEWRRIQKSKGYDWILVNGEITVENGEPTGALPGKFLRNGRG
jgi:N-acyl-D-aspartate/D-glutamate deacylase